MRWFDRLITRLTGLEQVDFRPHTQPSTKYRVSRARLKRHLKYAQAESERPMSFYSGLGSVEADIYQKNLSSASLTSVQLQQANEKTAQQLKRITGLV